MSEKKAKKKATKKVAKKAAKKAPEGVNVLTARPSELKERPAEPPLSPRKLPRGLCRTMRRRRMAELEAAE